MKTETQAENFFRVECPDCKQPIEGPSEMGGTMIGCPACGREFLVRRATDQTTEAALAGGVQAQRKKLPAWAEPGLLVLAALAIWILGAALRRGDGAGPPGGVIFDLSAAAVFAYGMAKGIWLACLRFGFGIVMLVAGVGILLVCWIQYQNVMGMIAGGFLGLIGAVLMAAKK